MADILSRIRKLVELSRNNPSQEEATQAAAMAQDLMFKYQIGEADIDMGDSKREAEAVVEDSIHQDGERRDVWKACLAHAVARGFGCHMYNGHRYVENKKTTSFQVVGLKSAVQTVSYIFSYLALEIDRLCDEAWLAHGKEMRQSAKTWKNSFRTGAVNAINARLTAQREAQDARFNSMFASSKATAPSAPASTALALYKSDEERVADTWKATEKRLRLRSGGGVSRTRSNPTAYARGREAGNGLQLGGGRGLAAPRTQMKP